MRALIALLTQQQHLLLVCLRWRPAQHNRRRRLQLLRVILLLLLLLMRLLLLMMMRVVMRLRLRVQLLMLLVRDGLALRDRGRLRVGVHAARVRVRLALQPRRVVQRAVVACCGCRGARWGDVHCVVVPGVCGHVLLQLLLVVRSSRG